MFFVVRHYNCVDEHNCNNSILTINYALNKYIKKRTGFYILGYGLESPDTGNINKSRDKKN